MENDSDLTILKTKEWIFSNTSQEKYGLLKRIRYNSELKWTLSNVYEHHLAFTSRVNMKLLML